MLNNEKAPTEAATSDKGANEINQLQDKPDFGNCQEPVNPVIPELIEMARRSSELYDSHGVVAFGSSGDPSVHLKPESFFALFGFGEYEDEKYGPEYDHYSATVGGIEFFCLVKKGEPK